MSAGSSYCSLAYPAAGSQLSDRSAYIPHTAYNIFAPGQSYPTVPSEWSTLTDYAAFLPPASLPLFQDATLKVPLDNGHGTWKPNTSIDTPLTPIVNEAPSNSSAPWMIPTCTPFQAQVQALGTNTAPGFTPLVSLGGQVVNAFVNNKYYQAASYQWLPNEKNFGINPNTVPYDFAMCNGQPCACVDSNSKPVGGAICYANQSNVEGLFGFPVVGCLSGTVATPQPTFSGSIENSTLVTSATPQCPQGLVAACKSSSQTATVEATYTVLYASCPMTSIDGEQYNYPLLCPDATAPTYANGVFSCGSNPLTCPNKVYPIVTVASYCSDASTPMCVNVECPGNQEPTAPSGYVLKPIYDGSVWSVVAIDPNNPTGTPANPICGYIGGKQVDLCACNCFLDASGTPIAEGPAIIKSDGTLGCADQTNTKPNATKFTIMPTCVSDGATLSAVPTCSNGQRAYYEPSSTCANTNNLVPCIVCADKSTPTCAVGQVATTGIVSLDPIPGTTQPSLAPVQCVSTLLGGVCEPFASKNPVPYVDGTLSCDDNFTLSCPGVTNPTITTVCANGSPPVCVSNNKLCTNEYNMSDFGKQALATPIDNLYLSNMGTVFCSSNSYSPVACYTILQSYFPSLSPPLGSTSSTSVAQTATNTSAVPLVVPDPMTAGILSQGICLSAGNTIPNYTSELTCATSTNPPTALYTWNEQGAQSMGLVPIGAPFPLTKVNGAFPSEVYFNSQAGQGNNYDSGLNYYLEQTCVADSSGACTSTYMAGQVLHAKDAEAHCVHPGDKLVVKYLSDSFVTPFDSVCSYSHLKPILSQKRPEFPSYDGICSVGSKHVCHDLNDTPEWDGARGAWICRSTMTPSICLPMPTKDKVVRDRTQPSQRRLESSCQERVTSDGRSVCDPIEALGMPAPNRACMNYINPSLQNGVEYPGQGAVSRLFAYDPVARTCVQQTVCPSGMCDSNIQAESIEQYHQGITLTQFPYYPTIFYSENSFPVEMFGDLGQPGNGQILNPTAVAVYPQGGYYVPVGFNYWPATAPSNSQGDTERVVAQNMYNYWYFFGEDFSTVSQRNSAFDTTGAGWNESTQVTSQGTNKDIYYSYFAPSVMGTLMSGAMTQAPGSSTLIQYRSYTTSNLATLGAKGYPYQNIYPNKWIDPDSSKAVSDMVNPSNVGYNLCPSCNFFFCQSDESDGGSCPNLNLIPHFLVGNIPNDPSNASCISALPGPGTLAENNPGCFTYNYFCKGHDYSSGGSSDCEGNLVCECIYQSAPSFFFTAYTYTADGENSCDSGHFCSPLICDQTFGVDRSDKTPVPGYTKAVASRCYNPDYIPA